MTPIEWLVLARDGNKALLISRYWLDAQPYNTDHTSVTWETCTLRTWLNVTFYNKAFSSDEQAAILTTSVDNGKNQGYSKWSTSGGNNTEDKVFLLSYAEANKYFGVTYDNISNTKSRVAPTRTRLHMEHGQVLPIRLLMALMRGGGGCGRLATIRTSPRSWTPTVLSATSLSTMSLVLSAPLCG